MPGSAAGRHPRQSRDRHGRDQEVRQAQRHKETYVRQGTEEASRQIIVQARILRADAAHAMGDDALTRALLDEAAGIELGAADQARIADDLTRAEELRGSLA